MNPLRKKMASLLTDAASKGIKRLNPGSVCAKALKKINVKNTIKEDISRICEAISFTETTRILSLVTLLKMEDGEKKEEIKSEIKKIAEAVVARVERESGKLKIPEPCRHLLLNL